MEATHPIASVLGVHGCPSPQGSRDHPTPRRLKNDSGTLPTNVDLNKMVTGHLRNVGVTSEAWGMLKSWFQKVTLFSKSEDFALHVKFVFQKDCAISVYSGRGLEIAISNSSISCWNFIEF